MLEVFIIANLQHAKKWIFETAQNLSADSAE